MLHYSYFKYPLQFAFDAKTSRGEIKTHDAYLIKIINPLQAHIIGWGEASPLAGLSIDYCDNFENQLEGFLFRLNHGEQIDPQELLPWPSIKFALETARLDLQFGGIKQITSGGFYQGDSIPINGLVWMASIDKMLEEASSKIKAGYHCIKFKIGAHDFDAECRMLEMVRNKYSAFKVEIRLDANGAMQAVDAFEKLKELSRFDIHSIEQPIATKQEEAMEELCRKTKIPIALDEELIGFNDKATKVNLLKKIRPQFIILKPTLLGGLAVSDEWIQMADSLNIGWWATSALESNIGLNAIAQWCSNYQPNIPQGLGTGSLYQNNIPSPLLANNGKLSYIAHKNWELPHQR